MHSCQQDSIVAVSFAWQLHTSPVSSQKLTKQQSVLLRTLSADDGKCYHRCYHTKAGVTINVSILIVTTIILVTV